MRSHRCAGPFFALNRLSVTARGVPRLLVTGLKIVHASNRRRREYGRGDRLRLIRIAASTALIVTVVDNMVPLRLCGRRSLCTIIAGLLVTALIPIVDGRFGLRIILVRIRLKSFSSERCGLGGYLIFVS